MLAENVKGRRAATVLQFLCHMAMTPISGEGVWVVESAWATNLGEEKKHWNCRVGNHSLQLSTQLLCLVTDKHFFQVEEGEESLLE